MAINFNLKVARASLGGSEGEPRRGVKSIYRNDHGKGVRHRVERRSGTTRGFRFWVRQFWVK